MISSNAKDSIDRIFRKAAQSRLPLDSSDACEIVSLGHDFADAMREPAGDVVVLTISSIEFRLLLVLHCGKDMPTREYFMRGSGETPFEERILEVGNLCCGAVNQELVRYFPDLGMSTPYALSARSVPYLDELRPALLASYRVTINESVHLNATVCVCAHAPMDFTAEVTAEVESGGELELF